MSSSNLESSAKIGHEAAAQLAAPFWRLISRQTNPIVKFNENGAGLAFYCVHSITGDVTILHDLARLVGPTQQFYGIQVPRVKMTAAFASSIQAVAQQHVNALIAFQPEGPIVVGGWSTGAIVALEMAQQLRALGRDVPLLVALDGAPCNTGGGISRWDPRYVWRLIGNMPRWVKDDQNGRWSLQLFFRRVIERIAFRVQVTSPVIKCEQTLNGDMVQNLLDNKGWSNAQRSFIRAMWDAQRTYVALPYPGHVLLYEAKIQPLFHLLQLSEAWKKIAPKLEIVPLDGGHGSIFREPRVAELAEHLRATLARIQLTMSA